MTKKQSNPMPPKGSKRPTPPPAPPALSKEKEVPKTSCTVKMPKVKKIKKQSNLLAPTSCEGKYYFKEDFFQKVPKPETEKPSSNQAPQINPEDYVRTVTEGCVKPTLEDFLYTKDRNEKPNADFNWACDRCKEICGQPIVSDKKVYCKDCKHCWQYECKNIAKIVPATDYYSQSYKIVYTLAHIENKDNNCKYYSEKWYIKLWRMFK